jgi:hypothetical protein
VYYQNGFDLLRMPRNQFGTVFERGGMLRVWLRRTTTPAIEMAAPKAISGQRTETLTE